jgi:hypothetical protein
VVTVRIAGNNKAWQVTARIAHSSFTESRV